MIVFLIFQKLPSKNYYTNWTAYMVMQPTEKIYSRNYMVPNNAMMKISLVGVAALKIL